MHRLQQGREWTSLRSAGTLIADTKSGTPGSDAVKVKGVITWVGVNDAVPAKVRLFVEAHPDAGGQGLY
jgi:glutaminyl-tRNA synthetase